jgi:hypothetical protein
MADWSYRPDVGYQMQHHGWVTLRDTTEDGGLFIREKISTAKRIFVGTFTRPTATINAMLDTLDTYRGSSTLDIVTYDPQAADPDTDEATVYVWNRSKPEPIYTGTSMQRIQVTFREA